MPLPPGVTPEIPGPGQESVWDYPRPPALVLVDASISIVLAGIEVCRARQAYAVKETSHPPTYYLPPDAWRSDALRGAGGGSWCEWKGQARYFDVVATDEAGNVVGLAPAAAWAYPEPSPAFAPMRDWVSVYPAAMDRVLLDGEQVRGQDGGFYGGWITSKVTGPFKGVPGSRWW